MDSLATPLTPDLQALLHDAMAALKAPEECLARHRQAVAALRTELIAMGHPMTTEVGWGDDDNPDDLIEVSLDLDEHGFAELGSALDRLFDLSLAQALNRVGSLMLSRPAPMSLLGGPSREQWCAIALDHGSWRYVATDSGQRTPTPNWKLL